MPEGGGALGLQAVALMTNAWKVRLVYNKRQEMLQLNLPHGAMEVRGRSAAECLQIVDTRLAEIRRGERRLVHADAGRLYGRVRGGGFKLSYRLTHLVHSGAIVLVADASDSAEGCLITYRSRIQRVTLAFWIVWSIALLAVIALSLVAPDPDIASRVTLSAAILALVPVIVIMSFRRGRTDVEVAIKELRGWLGMKVT